MKNVQKPEKIHLDKLIDEIKEGKFVIPDFQRDFEWNPWDVRDLIKSIFMDYFIGTLLLWKSNDDNYKTLSCNPIYGYSGEGSPRYIVLDGQQRLTAIHYAFFQPDIPFPNRKKPFLFFIRINEFIDENYEEAFFYTSKTNNYEELLCSPNKQFHTHLFPLGVLKGGSWDTDDWIKGYRDYWQKELEDYDQKYSSETGEIPPTKEEINQYIKNAKVLKNSIKDLLTSYNISYIELDADIEVGKVCDIFTHINSKGIRLDIFDLLNAILRPKEIKLKELWENASNRLAFTDPKKMKVHVLQVMSILTQSYCSPKYLYHLVPGASKIIKKEDGSKESTVLIPDTQTFNEKWHESISALEKTINILKDSRDLGAIKPEFVPYPSIIPALAAIRKYVENANIKNKIDVYGKIRKWYWASVFLKRYSSAVESTSAKDFMDLKKWFVDDNAIPDFINDFYTDYEKIDFHRETQKGTALFNAIFNLFIINEARDWETFELPEYDSLDDYYIVPQSWGKENTIGTEINSILNRTPLSSKTNRNIIGKQLPNVYLKNMFENNDHEKVFQVLQSHLISRRAVDILLRNPFTKDDYKEFLEERKQSILQAIKDKIIDNKIEFPPNLKKLDDGITKVELAIRNKITEILENNGTDNPYKHFIPSHIQQKVDERIKNQMKKNPALNNDDFEPLAKKLQFFDLQEYLQTITNNNLWEKFESLFRNKEKLSIKFNQLSGLRNSIRHDRDVDNITVKEGEAAISWFEKVLGI